MNKISSLLLAALTFSAASTSAQSVSALGVTKTRENIQTTGSSLTADGFSFSAFIEGDGVDESFPSASNRVTAPGGATTALAFDFDYWTVERFFTTQTALNTSFPNGSYSFKVGTDTIPLALSGTTTFPPNPLITASAGVWSGGRLKLTPAEITNGVNLSSNNNTGSGFLTLEIYSEFEDVLYETVTNEEPPSNISVDITEGMLTPGEVYTVEVEFDHVADSQPLDEVGWADFGASGFALFSSRTSFEIEIVSPLMEVTGNDNLIENGSSIPSLDNHTDFGSVQTSQSLKRTFTITNAGTATLTLDSVSITGLDASNFTVLKQPAASVAPGGSTTFEIVFEPAVEGDLSASVSFSTNDSNQPTFEMAIGGQGFMPAVLDFEMQPESKLVELGSGALLEALAVGDEAISYQWRKGSTAISGATLSSLEFANVTAADVAAYRVLADSPLAEPVLSEAAYVGVVTGDYNTRILKPGDKLTLTCTAVAPAVTGVSLSYAWRRESGPLQNGTQPNGAIVAGQDRATLTITNIQGDDASSYICEVRMQTPAVDDVEPVLEHGLVPVEVVSEVPELNFGSLPSVVSVSEWMQPGYRVTATNSPTSFSAKNLPPGVKLNTQTGQLTGHPTTPSKKNTAGDYIPYRIAFKASNPIGSSTEQIFEMVVEPLHASYVGTFHGVVSRDRTVNFDLGGHVQITVGKTGVISGSAFLAGQKHSVVGVLNGSVENEPTALLTVKRKPTSLGNLMLKITIYRDRGMSGELHDPKFEKINGTQVFGNAAEPDFLDGWADEARFSSPGGIALLPDGKGYVADTGNHSIRVIGEEGLRQVNTIAGNGVMGADDGTGDDASFASPEGLALDKDGNLYIADTGNGTIRRMTPSGVVTTYAGDPEEIGSTNGLRLNARFNEPCGLCFDPAGNLYVVDRGNHNIRKITPAGVVSTLAGKSGVPGHKDANGASALFRSPHGIVYEPVLKALFVTDTQNFVIRKITLTGTVSTYAGSVGVQSGADGLRANSRWFNPTGITTRGDGTLFVGDGVICQINPSGIVSTVSETLTEEGDEGNPVALAYFMNERSLIAVDNTVHGLISYGSAYQPPDLYYSDEEIVPEPQYFVAEFYARRQVLRSLDLDPLSLFGSYNATLESVELTQDQPQGYGYARLSILKTGLATWTGRTAAGDSFTFSSYVFRDESYYYEEYAYFVPLHGMMHKNTASLQGELLIDDSDIGLTDYYYDSFDWYKIAQPLKSTDRSYKSGIGLHEVNLFGGKYEPNHIYNYLELTSTPTTLNLDLSAGGLDDDINTTFRIASPNTVTAPTGMTLKIDPKTGIFTGSFKSGSPAVSSNFTGVILKNSAASAHGGYGYFLRPTSTAKTAPFLSGSVRFNEDL